MVFLLCTFTAFGQTITPLKTATNNPASCRVVNVKLDIAGTNPISNSDVILVIDVSASMNYTIPGDSEKSMKYAKDAAKTFIDAASVNPKNRIAIVSYTTNATLKIGLTELTTVGIASLKEKINSLTATNFTNIQDGITTASLELNTNGKFDCNTTRSIILLTDGVTNRTGPLGSTTNCNNNYPSKTNSCVISAIDAANNAKITTKNSINYNNQIFAIGLLGGVVGGDISVEGTPKNVAKFTLDAIQNGQNEATITLNGSSLTSIYNKIASEISWVAKDLSVKETVPDGYTINNISTTKGIVSQSGQVIDWNINFLNSETITLSYDLSPNASICGNQTVSSSVLTYTNSSCNSLQTDITTPITKISCPVITLDSQKNVSCFGENNGTITLNSPTGGVSPYTYDWLDLSGTNDNQNRENLTQGIYTVIAKDQNGCETAPLTVTITEPALLTCSISQDKAVTSNGLSDGQATVIALGGNGENKYKWDNFEETQTATKLSAGKHTVTVTDIKGCTTTCEIIISEPNVLSCSIIEDSPAKCYGDSNGIATVTPLGGNGEYTYEWDNGEKNAQAVALTAGKHTVTITDKLGYTTECDVVISQPLEALTATAIIIDNNNCSNCNNGSIDITVNGGTKPYTFIWSNGATTEDISNLPNGTYSLEIKDKNGCIANYTYIITESSIAITKDGTYVDSNNDGITNIGDIVSYNFVITNTGNVPLTNVTVTDNNAVITGAPIPVLAAGETDSTTFSGSHAITQEEINIGFVYNLATVTGKDPKDNPVTNTSSDPTPCTTCPIKEDCPDCTITPLPESPAVIEPINITSATCNDDTTLIDLNLLLPEGIPTNGTWIDTENTGGLTGSNLNAFEIPVNNYKYEYKIQGNHPRTILLTMSINDDCKVLPCKSIVIHNALSANEDGKNDYFQIDNLENNDCYKNFKVEIYNRWGILIFERENYNNGSNAFRGKSEGRNTINKNEGLPTGTYFYNVSYDSIDGLGKTQNIRTNGYLYLVK